MKLLQNSKDLLIASTSVNILAPVVVKPLTTSKKASINDGISLLKTKGKAPKIERIIQEKATMINPSLAKIF